LLVYLLNSNLVFTKGLDASQADYFQKVGENKLTMDVEDFCIDRAKCLKQFAAEVYKIGFDEDPQYAMLKFLLTKPLLHTDQSPDSMMDWSLFH
jgi:hypothetical protein